MNQNKLILNLIFKDHTNNQFKNLILNIIFKDDINNESKHSNFKSYFQVQKCCMPKRTL